VRRPARKRPLSKLQGVQKDNIQKDVIKQDVKLYEGWNFNSGNYLFTTDTK